MSHSYGLPLGLRFHCVQHQSEWYLQKMLYVPLEVVVNTCKMCRDVLLVLEIQVNMFTFFPLDSGRVEPYVIHFLPPKN